MNAVFVAAVLAIIVASAVPALADPQGLWETEGGRSRVLIESCDSGLCGRLVWLKDPVNSDGTDVLDTKNADEGLRNRPVLGIELLSGFAEAGRGRWTGGRIYNPEDGKTYSSRLVLRDDGTLRVRGCVLFICKSQIWVRVPGSDAGDSD